MTEQTVVPIIDVYWEGPYTLEDIKSKQKREEYCLYQIYGSHPVYGTNSLLYIGKTEKQYIETRLNQHKWIENQASECEIYIASCKKFEGWANRNDQGAYKFYNDKIITIDIIESLLIYAHQPSYNSQSLKTTSFAGNPFRLFNSNRRASIMPEISSQFYADPATFIVNDNEEQ
jgi:hypothetical protein